MRGCLWLVMLVNLLGPNPTLSSAMNALQSNAREWEGRRCRGEGPKSGVCWEKGNLTETDWTIECSNISHARTTYGEEPGVVSTILITSLLPLSFPLPPTQLTQSCEQLNTRPRSRLMITSNTADACPLSTAIGREGT